MGVFAQTARKVRSIWSQGEDEEYEAEEELDAPGASDDGSYRSSTQAPAYEPGYGGSNYSGGAGGGHARRLRPVALPLRTREKNIYTLRPKSQDEAAIAADYMKAGSAVVLNLEAVDRWNAIRIIDFMSGVCYGLEGQGHAMKLGDAIFLFTPAEFEISSDEIDYGENRDFFFKDMEPELPPATAAGSSQPISPPPASYQSGERRSWER